MRLSLLHLVDRADYGTGLILLSRRPFAAARRGIHIVLWYIEGYAGDDSLSWPAALALLVPAS